MSVVYMKTGFTSSTGDIYTEAVGVLHLDARPYTTSLRTPDGPVPVFQKIIIRFRIDWYKNFQAYLNDKTPISGPELRDDSEFSILPADGIALTATERSIIHLSGAEGAVATFTAIKDREEAIAAAMNTSSPLGAVEIVVVEPT